MEPDWGHIEDAEYDFADGNSQNASTDDSQVPGRGSLLFRANPNESEFDLKGARVSSLNDRNESVINGEEELESQEEKPNGEAKETN